MRLRVAEVALEHVRAPAAVGVAQQHPAGADEDRLGVVLSRNASTSLR